MIATKLYFHNRLADDDCPAGLTVSKNEKLPPGDFRITEYKWPDVVLWFVDADEFTADERELAAEAYLNGSHK